MSTPWVVGYVVGLVVVLIVLALVVPILLLARRIAGQAGAIDESLGRSVRNTAGLAQLHTTIEHATVIVAGLQRGRQRLGG
jgi:hypothetical protein